MCNFHYLFYPAKWFWLLSSNDFWEMFKRMSCGNGLLYKHQRLLPVLISQFNCDLIQSIIFCYCQTLENVTCNTFSWPNLWHALIYFFVLVLVHFPIIPFPRHTPPLSHTVVVVYCVLCKRSHGPHMYTKRAKWKIIWASIMNWKCFPLSHWNSVNGFSDMRQNGFHISEGKEYQGKFQHLCLSIHQIKAHMEHNQIGLPSPRHSPCGWNKTFCPDPRQNPPVLEEEGSSAHFESLTEQTFVCQGLLCSLLQRGSPVPSWAGSWNASPSLGGCDIPVIWPISEWAEEGQNISYF